VTLLAAGCGGTATRSGVEAARACKPGSVRAVAPEAAVATRPLAAFRAPGRRLIDRFGLLNVNRFPTVFGVVEERVDRHCKPTWLHVRLPLRPNGITGWVRADRVERVPVRARIVVDLSEKTLRLFEGDTLKVRSTVAIGADATPTPLGRYYVNQRLVPTDQSGPFGPGAIGISAFSPVLTGWAQGGPVAIHGTNAPWSIGHAVSNGCIRVPNDVLKRLWPIAVAGTPVIIER
jgi:hypothetical protein